MEYDEDEHSKEVYAHFGLAFYWAGCFETGLANAMMQADFLIGWKKKIYEEGKRGFDRKVYEAEFDAYMKNQNEQTLGNLIKRFSKTFTISDALQTKISEAKSKRDFLTHHYFRERATDFAHRKGRDRMIAELSEMRELFREVDAEIGLLADDVFPQLGISRETVDKYTAEYLEKVRREEL